MPFGDMNQLLGYEIARVQGIAVWISNLPDSRAFHGQKKRREIRNPDP